MVGGFTDRNETRWFLASSAAADLPMLSGRLGLNERRTRQGPNCLEASSQAAVLAAGLFTSAPTHMVDWVTSWEVSWGAPSSSASLAAAQPAKRRVQKARAKVARNR